MYVLDLESGDFWGDGGSKPRPGKQASIMTQPHILFEARCVVGAARLGLGGFLPTPGKKHGYVKG